MDVTNWMDDSKPPEKPTIHDMRYGLGCMNDLTIDMADLFKESMVALEKPIDRDDLLEMIESMDKKTLGGLWLQFKEYYDGELISPKKVKHAISERNYFIHEYHNINPSKNDGKQLFDLIKLLMKVKNQLTAVRNNICKKNKKTQNIKNDVRRKEMIKAIRSCKQFEPGKVYLSELGNELCRQNIVLDKKMKDVIGDLGWTMYYSSPETKEKLYLLVDEIK